MRPAPLLSRRLPLLPVLALLLPLSAPLLADTVVLANGRTYEGVIAERTADGVQVRIAFGQITIPASQVREIRKEDSPLAEYLRRKAELARRPEQRAADWLQLARWAKVHGNDNGVREAALLAAEIDPQLPGLEALLRPLGLVFEHELLRWIPYEEAMSRRGLVRHDGEWITVAEQRQRVAELEERRRAHAQELAARRMADAADALRRSSEQMAARERDARREHAEELLDWYAPYYALPVMVPPLVVVTIPGRFHPPHRPRHPHDPHPHPAPPAGAHGYSRFQSRQPGSFLPADPVGGGGAPVSGAPMSSSTQGQ